MINAADNYTKCDGDSDHRMGCRLGWMILSEKENCIQHVGDLYKGEYGKSAPHPNAANSFHALIDAF